MGTKSTWTTEDLFAELRQFERELRDAGLKDASVATYVQRSHTFVRWLAGDYTPTGPRT